MIIDLAAIDRTQFLVEDRDGFVLVRPQKLKHVWEPHELHLRSLLCRPNGEVVSAGFPKFFNYGENAASDAEADALIGAGRCVFTEKLDGSLIIRSNVDGRVILRTRGNHELGEFEWVRKHIEMKHPSLLDWRYGDDGFSTLYEITAPNNQIVVQYHETKLTPLGWVEHKDLSVWMLPSAPRHSLSASSGGDAIANVDKLSGEEGVVAWCQRHDGSYHLVKFKSAWYLRAHALKSFATHDRIRDYVWTNKIRDTDAFVSSLMRDGVDFETAKQHVNVFLEVVTEQAARRAEIEAALDHCASVRVLPDRKSKALALKEQAPPQLFGALIFWAVGDEAKYLDAAESYALGMTSNQFLELKRKQPERLVLDVEAARRAE